MQYLISIDYGATDVRVIDAVNEEEAILSATRSLLEEDPSAVWIEAQAHEVSDLEQRVAAAS